MAKPRQPKTTDYGVGSVQRSNKPVIFAAVGVVVALAIAAGLVALAASDKDSGTYAIYQEVAVSGTPVASYPDKEGQADAGVGMKAPDLSGKGFEGESVNIKSDGRPKIVMFAAHWCPHCNNEMPLIANWLKDNRSKYGEVDFYTVATGTTPARPANYPPGDWFTKLKLGTPILVDSRASAAGTAYGLTSYPFLVAVDGSGKVLQRASGELPMTSFEDLVKKARDAKAS